MSIKDNIIKTIETILNNEGTHVSLRKDFEKKEFDLNPEIESDNIEVSIRGNYINHHLFLGTIIDMITNNEIDIILNENATEKHINYLNELSKNL